VVGILIFVVCAYLAYKIYISVSLNSAYGALVCLRGYIRRKGISPETLDQEMIKAAAWNCYVVARDDGGVNRPRLLEAVEVAATSIVEDAMKTSDWHLTDAKFEAYFNGKDPVYVADCFIRQKLKERGVDYRRLNQEYLAALARNSVCKARCPDGSIDPIVLRGCLQTLALDPSLVRQFK
jgi:hypothetical protein